MTSLRQQGFVGMNGKRRAGMARKVTGVAGKMRTANAFGLPLLAFFGDSLTYRPFKFRKAIFLTIRTFWTLPATLRIDEAVK